MTKNMFPTTVFMKIKNIVITGKHPLFLWRNSLSPNATEMQKKINKAFYF